MDFNMYKLSLSLCLFLCALTVFADENCSGGRLCSGYRQVECPPNEECVVGRCCQTKVRPLKICPSGVIGPSCDKRNPCKPGYTCRRRKCCRDVTCPFGGEGPTCSLTDPCKPGYYCNKGICCWEYTCRPEELSIGCSSRKPCPYGSVCQGGECCRQPVCPDGRASDRVCSPPTSTEPICPIGYECLNGICCQTMVNECPAHIMMVDPNCNTPDKCKTDADCKEGELCCTSPCNRYCKGPGFPG